MMTTIDKTEPGDIEMNDKFKKRPSDKLNHKKKYGVVTMALMTLIGLALIISSCAGPRYGGHGGHHSYMQDDDRGGYSYGQGY
jgi:hypothetical protein